MFHQGEKIRNEGEVIVELKTDVEELTKSCHRF